MSAEGMRLVIMREAGWRSAHRRSAAAGRPAGQHACHQTASPSQLQPGPQLYPILCCTALWAATTNDARFNNN